MNEDSAALNSFRGEADMTIQAGSIHGGVHIHHPQDHVDVNARVDADEVRTTGLYEKATNQLGSDKALVRLAGLYAAERFAQNNADHRQTIVNLVCGYLRMPYQPPEPADEPVMRGFLHVHHRSRSKPPAVDERAVSAHHDQMQEREVRLAAQRILTDHLQPGDSDDPVSTFWPDIDLDLTGAVLIDFTLARCAVRTATFESAAFIGHTDFTATVFTGEADFRLASFTDPNAVTYFQSAVFAESVYFMGTTFAASAAFAEARFGGAANFMSSSFTSLADFTRATFTSTADFGHADFARSATFTMTTFNSTAHFYGATFPALHTSFLCAAFAKHVPQEVDQFSSPEKLRSLWTDPTG